MAGWILWWIAETLLFGQMLRWLFVHAGRDKAVQEDGIGKGIGKRIFLIFAGLLIAWLPVLLSNDPGFYNYDIYGQVPQVCIRRCRIIHTIRYSARWSWEALSH
jgi:hypothetical protein